MKIRIYAAPLICLAIALAIGRPVFSQAPAAPPAPTTIWNFLGIPQGVNKIRDATINRRGNFPGLERRPPLKAIADPANLTSGVPAMEAAAEIKQAEDLKKQKIKAIKYLARIGCGCYDKDKKVTKALLASMEDCTEEVRLAAVEAVLEAAEGKLCANCHSACCCGKEIVEKLSQIAYERDDTGCFIEPSERVRAAAQEALAACCPNRLPLNQVETLPPVEGTQGQEVIPEGQLPGVVPEGQPAGDAPPIPVPNTPSPSDAPGPQTSAPDSGSTASQLQPLRELAELEINDAPPTRMVSSRRRFRAQPAQLETTDGSADELDMLQPPSMNAIFELGDEPPTTPAAQRAAPTVPVRMPSVQLHDVSARRERFAPVSPETSIEMNDSPVVNLVKGHVEFVDLNQNLVTVHLHDQRELRAGSLIKVYHEYLTGRTALTKLEVVISQPGVAYARPTEPGKIGKIARGDEIVGW